MQISWLFLIDFGDDVWILDYPIIMNLLSHEVFLGWLDNRALVFLSRTSIFYRHSCDILMQWSLKDLDFYYFNSSP